MKLSSHANYGELPRDRGFSLIEVVVALGVIAFAVVTLVALVPVGLQVAKNSSEETQGLYIISALTSALQQNPQDRTDPDTNAVIPATSDFHGVPLPWINGAANSAIDLVAAAGSGYVLYVGEDQVFSDVEVAGSRYRVTVQYTRVPGKTAGVAAASLSSIEALVTVSWPYTQDIADPDDASRIDGRVESYLVLPKP